MHLSLLCALVASFLPLLVVGETFDLSSLQWTLKNENGSIVVPGSVPSQAHLDLVKAGIITEPLLGINDYTERWVVNDNWTYTADITPFIQSLSSTAAQKTLLVFYGLDTIANITLAGQPVAWVANEFLQYVFDVSDILASSEKTDNNLTVAFESAWYYGMNVTERPDAEWTTSDNFEYPNVRQWIRKIASDFGWDWGPAFVPSGIFKPAYLVTLPASTYAVSTLFLENAPPYSPPATDSSPSPIFIEELSVDTYKVGQNFYTPPDETADWIMNVTLLVRSAIEYSSPRLTLSIPELGISSEEYAIANIPAATGASTALSVQWTIPDAVPERWYPFNLGNPKLYNLTASLELSPSSSASFTTTTGFRTIQIVQTPYTEEEIATRGITPGDNWHFAVNGEAFYSKGTNIIPFDPFYARINPEAVRWVLESAKASGQNMLRVWGGGTYQPSDTETAGGVYDFYSICDELGILAWSELIFSDDLYPIDSWLLAEVEPEVRQNVRRVNRHPSIAQWAGGNEIEGIVMTVNTTQANGTHYLDEFVYLFQDYLYGIVTSESRSVPYTDCSTTHGVLSLDPYVLRFANGTAGDIYGNSERYIYDGTQAFNVSTFPVSRFVNEFGFHSMPSFYSWEEVLENPEDFAFNSTVVMSRDHHPPAGNLSWPNPNAPQGQYQMSSSVELWLPTPGTTDANQTFAQWCWSTQVFQTMTMAAQIQWYRRGAGLGENNLGSLVWQLNDIWQGVSWAAIEYSGRWKVLNYGLAQVYAPVIISPFWIPTNQSLEILVTSDVLQEVSGTAQLTWYTWSGSPVSTALYDFTTPPLNNSVLYSDVGLENILPSGSNADDVWLLLNLTADVGGTTVTNEQYFTPVSLAYANLVDPEIEVTRYPDLTFTLSAKGGVSAWTWLDHPSGTVGSFVDSATLLPTNGFYLIPGLDRTVTFVQNAALSTVLSPNPEDFVVRSVWNNTHI